MLSGGLDSSSIVTTADELRGDEDDFRLYTYSAVFDEEELPSSDEREYIDAVLEECSATPRFFRGDQRDPLGDLETILYHSETPVLGNNFYLSWNVYRAAGEDGVRVLLDGTGGDQVVSHGMGYLPELALNGRWLTLASEIRAFDEKFEHGSKIRELLLNQTLVPLLPTSIRKTVMTVRNDEFRDVVRPTLDPEFVDRTDARDRLFDSVTTRPATARKLHYSRLRSDIVVLALERVNKTSKALGVEPRYPFFDRRLMEFCFALPADQKIRQGWIRYVLRNAMEGVLPRAVQWRPEKATLAPSFWRALRVHATDDIANILFEDESRIAEYIDLERARSGYQEFVEGGTPGLGTVWIPVVLERWFRSKVGPNSQ
jgi:asparagine synthase (glutamine-hydrolysing)